MTLVGRQRQGRSGLCAIAVMLTYAVALFAPADSIGVTPACVTGQLHHLVAAAPRHRAVNGQITLFRAFANTGNACILHGYPRVELLDQAGMPIGTHARVGREPNVAVQEVHLARHGLAYFRLYIRDGALCAGHRFTFYGLTVDAPSNLRERLAGTDACDFSAHVSPFRAAP